MKTLFSLPILSLLAFGAPLQAEEAPRIATVDMQKLIKEYHRTDSAQKELNVARLRIEQANAERLEVIGALEDELELIRKQLDDPSISDKKKGDLFKSFQLKTQEGISLDRERREFIKRRTTALNEKMMMIMRKLLEEVRALVVLRAKTDDYDYVFDRSGISTSQVPFLLYSKDAVDLTGDLLKTLNKDAPQESKKAG